MQSNSLVPFDYAQDLLRKMVSTTTVSIDSKAEITFPARGVSAGVWGWRTSPANKEKAIVRFFSAPHPDWGMQII